MRLSPGIGSILLREVMKPGISVGGTYFPPGTDIGLPNYAIHHNEDYFPNFSCSIPLVGYKKQSTRLAGVTAEEVQLAQPAYAPFSVGRAGYLG